MINLRRTALRTRPGRHLAAGLIVVGLAIMAAPQGNASALTGAEFRAGNIISDSIFFNSTAMTPAQIQNFLNAKVPSCDTAGAKMHHTGQTRAQYGASTGNPAPYTCLKDYVQNTPARAGETNLCNAYGGGTKSAAQIIYDVAQVCGINPQVLIVLLQKEQSLITDDWPWNEQYQKATGFACPDTAPCDAEYAGFFNQVYNAGRIYRKYARDASQFNYRAGRNNNILYNPNAACGASNVYIENQATAGLYVYTPYQPNAAALNNLYGTGDACSAYGNRNFWRMFNDWFGNTQGSQLVRTPSNGTYHLLTSGRKYAIPNGDILYAYGLENMRVDVISDNYLNSVTDGGVLGTTFMVFGDGTVFMADGAAKYGIASGEYCTRWALDCDGAAQKILGPEIVDRMANGGVLQAMMQHKGGIYLMENGTKKLFLSMKSLVERGYNPVNATPIVNWTNAIKPAGQSMPENNSFVQFAGNGTIFLYTGGNFYTFPDFETFRSWRGTANTFHFDNSSSYLIQPPTPTGSLNSIITINSTRYLLDGGKRIDLTPASGEWAAGMNASSLQSMVNTLPLLGSVSTTTAFRSPDGAIFRVEGQLKRPFMSLYDYRELQSAYTHQLATTSVPLANGPPLLAPGSGYKVTGSPVVYLVGSGNKTYAFNSVRQVFDFRTNPVIPTISSSDASQFTVQGTLSDRVTDSHGTSFAIAGGTRHVISSSYASSWGFATSANQVLPDAVLSRIPLGTPVTSFISTPSGTIYAAGSGNKRPITSYAKYQALGGNASNTVALPNELVDTLPTGSPIP